MANGRKRRRVLLANNLAADSALGPVPPTRLPYNQPNGIPQLDAQRNLVGYNVQVLNGLSTDATFMATVPLAGQPAWVSDSRQFYIGDGANPISLLPVYGSSVTQTITATASPVTLPKLAANDVTFIVLDGRPSRTTPLQVNLPLPHHPGQRVTASCSAITAPAGFTLHTATTMAFSASLPQLWTGGAFGGIGNMSTGTLSNAIGPGFPIDSTAAFYLTWIAADAQTNLVITDTNLSLADMSAWASNSG